MHRGPVVCGQRVPGGHRRGVGNLGERDGSRDDDDGRHGHTETSESSETESTSDGPCTAPEIECDGGCVNPLTDDINCGECGHACIVGGGAGGCVDGSCSPRLSECVDWSNPMPCNEVCAQLGATCVVDGCPFGSTYVMYDALEDCLAHNRDGFSSSPCTEPDFVGNGAYRCCCTQ